MTASAIYTGRVRHRRFSPRRHAFSYRVFMLYLDLSELDGLFARSWLFSHRRPALGWMRREDFLGDPALPLEEAVRRRVAEEQGERPAGPIRLLTNLRYFGKLMNPISCYYCFAEDGERLQYIVAEVTNTPWGRRHSYVLPADPAQARQRIDFAKELHVSPFNPMEMVYRWYGRTPGERLSVHIENHRAGRKEFDATLSLRREAISTANLRRKLLRYPWMTLKVAAAIYFEALRLAIKRVPYYAYPKTDDEQGAARRL